MRESSLEDFLGSSNEEAGERKAGEDDQRSGDEESMKAEEAGEIEERTHEMNDIESATATYAWTPDGTDCPECGETVERRWRDGDRLVCAECKRW